MTVDLMVDNWNKHFSQKKVLCADKWNWDQEEIEMYGHEFEKDENGQPFMIEWDMPSMNACLGNMIRVMNQLGSNINPDTEDCYIHSWTAEETKELLYQLRFLNTWNPNAMAKHYREGIMAVLCKAVELGEGVYYA